MIWLLLACSEYSYTSKVQKDVFQQVRRNTVDILLVVDDSCSMAEEQEKLAGNFEAFISVFTGVDVDWQIGVTTTDTYYTAKPGMLIGGSDELVLVDTDGRTIDAVRWNRDWAYEEGIAMQLDINKFSTTSNTSIMNWCASTNAYNADNYGSPGGENHACTQNAPLPPNMSDTGDTGTTDTGTSDGTDDTGTTNSGVGIAPRVGDIIFTEMMVDSKGIVDSLGEWIEITNLTDEYLDLGGYGIRDDGRNYFAFPDNTVVEPRQRFIVGRSADSSVNGGVGVDVVSSNLTLANKLYYLTSKQDDVQENFEEMVVVGTEGSGIEMGLEAAKRALSEPLRSAENQGFLRDEANLSLIFISDEDDSSPMSAHHYLQVYSDIKGDAAYRDHNLVNVSAVVGMDRPPYEGEPSCISANGVGYYGPKYIELVNRSQGKVQSICAEDFSPIAAELGLVASGLQLEFALSELPDLETLKVKLYAENTEESFIRELTRVTDYSYSIENNSIIFVPESLPASETYILAEYKVLPSGAIISDTAENTNTTGGAQ